MNSKTFAVYLDESGNSGANYLDKNQPFFVLAGCLITENNSLLIERKILEWERQLDSQASEIKGANLVRRIKGRKAIFDLLKILGKNGAVFTYSTMEKRLGICAKFIDAVFDSSYNSSIPESFFSDPEAKYALADSLYDKISDDLLYEFGKAVQSKDVVQITTRFLEVAEFSLTLGIDNFNLYVKSCPIEPAVNYLSYGDSISGSINSTMLTVQIKNLENFSRLCGMERWSLYHDNIETFQKSLEDIIGRFNKGWASYLNQEFHLGLPSGGYSIEKFSFLDSRASPLIRAADCFAALTRYYLERLEDEELFADPIEQTGILLTLGPMLRYVLSDHHIPPMFHEMLSTEIARKTLNRIFNT